jgi:hypothetical protein
MQSMATHVNYVHTIKITQKFKQLGTPLNLTFALAVHKPAQYNGYGGPLPKEGRNPFLNGLVY